MTDTKTHAERRPIDLFWDPVCGELVMLKPEARRGITAEDDYPLRVVAITRQGGETMFSCQTTGPVSTRISPTGRRIQSHPEWVIYAVCHEIQPAEVGPRSC